MLLPQFRLGVILEVFNGLPDGKRRRTRPDRSRPEDLPSGSNRAGSARVNGVAAFFSASAKNVINRSDTIFGSRLAGYPRRARNVSWALRPDSRARSLSFSLLPSLLARVPIAKEMFVVALASRDMAVVCHVPFANRLFTD
jgi:hypothetical protein